MRLAASLAFALVSGCASDPTPPMERASGGASADPGGDALVEPRTGEEDLAGVWHLNAGTARLELTLTVNARTRALGGEIAAEGSTDAPSTIADPRWDDLAGTLRFSVSQAGMRAWFTARVTDGVMAGRFALGASETEPDARQFTGHFTGWSAAVADRELVPRVWDLRTGAGGRARLRVDRDASGALIGTFKVYARGVFGALGEELEYDLEALSWNGERLGFSFAREGVRWRFDATASGRSLSAVSTSPDGESLSWQGARAEVLSHGLSARPLAEQTAWRSRVRGALSLLVMNGAPPALETRAAVTQRAEVPAAELAAGAPKSWGYTLSDVRFEHTLADPRSGVTLVRGSHALLAVPTGLRPNGGFPLVIALNGHNASAESVMDSRSRYWYGDAYARRGYIVLAVDVSHRPLSDRVNLYTDVVNGDDAAHGNGPHPAIAAPGLDTDWEEDGERAWDAMRALDYALDNLPVREGRVLAAGLSLGAEVATYFAALDTRVDALVAASFSPDFAVMRYHGNHPCWRWRYGDLGEYIDASDLHGLVAPRITVVETGAVDTTFSHFSAPFAGDKQVLRRSRAAFDPDARWLFHDLHPGAHVFHAGDPFVDLSAVRGLTVPLVVEPTQTERITWQTDSSTRALRATVFDLMRLRERD